MLAAGLPVAAAIRGVLDLFGRLLKVSLPSL
jgi:hypothetical protein